MARIRSIKPDFFTSETITSLPVSARLTFIGIWTHADDNGVCLDNERLIAAALWPLENDPAETLVRLREDLRRLHEALLIDRYERAGKRYLFANSWDEHQKVSHPRKPRYPRPTEDGCKPLTCDDAAGRAPLRKSSGKSPEDRPKVPEILRPEQGAGSREQGAGIPTTSGAPAPTGDVNPGAVVAAWVEAIEGNGVKASGGMRGQVGKLAKELLTAGNDPARVLEAARQAGVKGFATIDRELAAMNGRAVANVRQMPQRSSSSPRDEWMDRA